jgi:hypothetical protein
MSAVRRSPRGHQSGRSLGGSLARTLLESTMSTFHASLPRVLETPCVRVYLVHSFSVPYCSTEWQHTLRATVIVEPNMPCGVVWCGVVRCGAGGVVRFGIVCGVVWGGVVCGVVRCGRCEVR